MPDAGRLRRPEPLRPAAGLERAPSTPLATVHTVMSDAGDDSPGTLRHAIDATFAGGEAAIVVGPSLAGRS